MHVALSNGHVAVPGKMGKGPGVHVRCPASQARMTQRVQREWLDIVPLLSGLLIVLGPASKVALSRSLRLRDHSRPARKGVPCRST